MEHIFSAILRQLMCVCFILMVLYSYYPGIGDEQKVTNAVKHGVISTEAIRRTEPRARPPTNL